MVYPTSKVSVKGKAYPTFFMLATITFCDMIAGVRAAALEHEDETTL